MIDTFWHRVNNLIKNNSTTQEWVCKQCGINLGTFKNQISKKTEPSVIEAYHVAKVLNTTVEYLVTGITSNPAEQELKQLKKNLSELSK